MPDKVKCSSATRRVCTLTIHYLDLVCCGVGFSEVILGYSDSNQTSGTLIACKRVETMTLQTEASPLTPDEYFH